MQDALGAVQSVLVLGGGSEIGLATARALIARRARTVVLAARRPETLSDAVANLQSLGATTCEAVPFDADDTASHDAFVADTFDRFGDFDLVLLTFGVLGDEEQAQRDGGTAVDVMRTNLVGAVSVGVPVANRLQSQGHGVMVVLSSVAGERARRSNFVYGASKAGLDAFFQGMSDALTDTGVRVMVVRPGFVHTKMTEGMDAAPLSTTPEAVADAIVRGLERGSQTVWVPSTLRYVMSGLRHLPRPVFRRLPL
jgi:decaprenylphospho-beta-D-erythro-pentofuranosid-2-ulose 2-reductase